MKGQMIRNDFSEETIPYEDYIAGLGKGLAVLEAFGTNKQKLNVAQVSEKTKLTKTATRRYLKTLKFLGYLEADQYYYWLSYKVLRFSGAFLNTAQLPRVSQAILNFLATNTTLVYSVVVLDAYEAVTIARSHQNEDGFRVRPFGIHLGNRVPAHTSSAGKTLLAHKTLSEQESWLNQYPMKQFTAFTCIDTEQFLEQLIKIKHNGYSISAEEYEIGVIAMCVPIMDYTGNVVAGLTAVAPTHKVSEQYLIEKILPFLRDAAKEIKAMI